MADTESSSPLFIERACLVAGSGKSGTTLLVALLDGHPNLVAFPEETAYFPTARRKFRFAGRTKQAEYLMETAESRLLFDLEGKPRGNRDYSNFPRLAFREAFTALAQDPNRQQDDLLALLMVAYAQVTGINEQSITRWIEKTPANRWCIPDILQTYPRGKVMLTLRDPRAITAAFLRRQRANPKGSFSFYLCVKNWMEAARLVLEPPAGMDFHVVRFESLILETEKTMREVCAFLEIPFQESVLAPTKAGQSWRGNSASNERFTGINPTPVAQWKEVLQPDEIAYIESYCGPAMEALGYPLIAQTNWRSGLRKFPEESLKNYLKDRRRSVGDRFRRFWQPPALTA